MVGKEYISVAEFARVLGISRIAVHKKIKKGQVAAVRIGRSYAIPGQYLTEITGGDLSEKTKGMIEEAVIRAVEQYAEVLRLLGRE